MSNTTRPTGEVKGSVSISGSGIHLSLIYNANTDHTYYSCKDQLTTGSNNTPHSPGVTTVSADTKRTPRTPVTHNESASRPLQPAENWSPSSSVQELLMEEEQLMKQLTPPEPSTPIDYLIARAASHEREMALLEWEDGVRIVEEQAALLARESANTTEKSDK